MLLNLVELFSVTAYIPTSSVTGSDHMLCMLLGCLAQQSAHCILSGISARLLHSPAQQKGYIYIAIQIPEVPSIWGNRQLCLCAKIRSRMEESSRLSQ